MKLLVSLLISLALMHYAQSVCVTVQSGDTCSMIETRNGCAANSIINNNGGIDAGCTNLGVGTYSGNLF